MKAVSNDLNNLRGMELLCPSNKYTIYINHLHEILGIYDGKNVIKVSIDELVERFVFGYSNFENALRAIDNHIRSTSDPIPHIIETLKQTLPEYKN